MQKTVLHNQSLLDVALQYCGTINAVFDIAILNNKSITAPLIPGEVLQIPEKDYGNSEIVEYYQFKKVVPATAIVQSVADSTDTDYVLPQVFPIIL